MTQPDVETASKYGGEPQAKPEDSAHTGVKKVEATHKVYGKYSKRFLLIGLAIAAYVYSFEGTTTYSYLAFATSSFSEHSLLSSIQVTQSIIIACGQPITAKISDVSSRGLASCFVLLAYLLGYIILATAHGVGAIAGGVVFYAMGTTGLGLLIQILVADLTTLKWRGIAASMVSLPFIINAFVGSNIATQILKRSGWRWGYGMLGILVPAGITPLALTLVWAERKAGRLGLIEPSQTTSYSPRAIKIVHQLDIFGLMLMGASVALLLLPLTLANNSKGRWHNESMIAMLVVGIVLIPVIVLYEWKLAKYPVVPTRLLRNKAVVAASLINFFDFISSALTNTYLYSFILVVKDWPPLHVTYFSNIQIVALVVFGIMSGIIMKFTQRYRYIQTIGLSSTLLGVGLMIHSRGANSNDAEIIWTQLLQGLGAGLASITTQVGTEASVPHADLAIAIAVISLMGAIGNAVGTAIAGAIWTNIMPHKLAQHLAFLNNATAVKEIYGSVVIASSFPRGNPIREGVIAAYGEVMKPMLILATCLSVLPVVFSFLMPNYELGDVQNAVDHSGLAGEEVTSEVQREDPNPPEHEEFEKKHPAASLE